MQNRLYLYLPCLLLVGVLGARTFKMATITPENSPWTQTMKQFGQKIARDTGGRVRVKVYAGGIAGEEGDVLRKIKIGQLDGALFSALGVTEIAPSSLVMSLPFLIENEEQLSQVVDHVHDLFDREAEKRGYVVLSWAFSGWVHMFSQHPLRSLDDFSKVRLALSSDQVALVEGWQAIGAQTRSIAFFDTPTGLQNGLINTFFNTPTGALAFQWFALAKNMTSIPLAPLTGAVVLSQRSWKKISTDDQQLILAEMEEVREKFQQQSTELDQQALKVMVDNGLQVVPISEDERLRWKDVFVKQAYPMVVGDDKAVSAELYGRVKELLAGK